MGYNSRIYFVKRQHQGEGKFYITNLTGVPGTHTWAEVIASVEMCKYSKLYNFFKENGAPTQHYILDTDDNTEILQDDYKQPLLEVSLMDLHKFLFEESVRSAYRRIMPLLALTHIFLTEKDKWVDDIVVLHYGH